MSAFEVNEYFDWKAYAEKLKERLEKEDGKELEKEKLILEIIKLELECSKLDKERLK